MSWVRIWIHLVFSTLNREPYLNSPKLRKQFFEHIKQNAEQKQVWLDSISGYQEHVHCLILLGKEQSVSKVAQLIKGESSFWINKTGLIRQKFTWQDDYWAVGVSESHAQFVRNYICEQDKHHGTVSFTDEVETFMAKYGWQLIGGNAAKAGSPEENLNPLAKANGNGMQN